MLLVRGTALTAAGGRLLVACDPFGPLCPGSTGFAGRVENAGAQESGDKLQLV